MPVARAARTLSVVSAPLSVHGGRASGLSSVGDVVAFHHACRSLPLERSTGEHPSRDRPAGPVGQSGACLVDDGSRSRRLPAGRAGADGVRTDALHRDGGSNGLGVGLCSECTPPAGGSRPDDGLTDPSDGPFTATALYAGSIRSRNSRNPHQPKFQARPMKIWDDRKRVSPVAI
jgi:hypothetical protein